MTNNTKSETAAVAVAVVWEACMASDLVEGPMNEDGERPILEVYYVTVTNERGDRYASKKSSRDQAEIEKLLGQVEKGFAAGLSPVNSAKWYRSRPVYGSEAYVAYGAAEEVAAEKKADEMEAFTPRYI
jgi:hypothetical protein